MNKRFLLTAGDYYYPQSGTEDWVGIFATYEEASALISKTVEYDYFIQGPRKGQIKPGSKRELYKVGDRDVGWYEIVDLELWGK